MNLIEMLLDKSPVKMTNIYPWVINTGMFSGYKPILAKFIPELD